MFCVCDLILREIIHRISFSSTKGQKHEKQWFEIRRNVHHNKTISIPSSISCLSGLNTYDDYFLASSMDGTIGDTL
ncbi:hypothetical protein L1887_33991 [Cichorium endivia]|nr:hypothetical protein L1887_33991 [Cichorium endivia]